MLAIITPPVMIFLLIAIVLFLMWLVPKLKNSKSVDKLTDDLFKAPDNSTVDKIVDGIKDSKGTLLRRSKDNAKKVKDFAKEQAKIDRGLKK